MHPSRFHQTRKVGSGVSTAAAQLIDMIGERLARRDTGSADPGSMPEHLQGDGPCQDCGGENIRWFTDNVLWNEVLGGPEARDDPGGLLCPQCFIKRVDAAGLEPSAWRLLPEWRWQRSSE